MVEATPETFTDLTREGSVLVTAKVFEDVGEAQGIMRRHGGVSIRFGEHAPLV